MLPPAAQVLRALLTCVTSTNLSVELPTILSVFIVNAIPANKVKGAVVPKSPAVKSVVPIFPASAYPENTNLFPSTITLSVAVSVTLTLPSAEVTVLGPSADTSSETMTTAVAARTTARTAIAARSFLEAETPPPGAVFHAIHVYSSGLAPRFLAPRIPSLSGHVRMMLCRPLRKML